MKRLILVFLVFVSTSTTAARLERATIVQRDAGNFAAEMQRLMASPAPVWIAWDVPTNDPEAQMCCFSSVEEGQKRRWLGGRCILGNGKGTFNIGTNNSSPGLKRDTFAVYVRASKGAIDELRMFSEDCVVDAAGAAVTHVNGVSVADSVRFLERVASDPAIAAIAMHRGSEGVEALERLVTKGEGHAAFWLGHKGGARGRRFLREVIDAGGSGHLLDQAIAGIAQDESREATDLLLSLARSHRLPQVRKHAIFWLGQKAGEKATAQLKEAADDPNSDVREMAVFAISQLPPDRAIPELIALARSHKSRTVREKAIFWLGQSDDPRALDFIEEVLTR